MIWIQSEYDKSQGLERYFLQPDDWEDSHEKFLVAPAILVCHLKETIRAKRRLSVRPRLHETTIEAARANARQEANGRVRLQA